MRIQKITTRLGRDIYGVLECEHCGHSRNFTGYDDSYYHNTVLPSFCCDNCKKNRAGKIKGKE